MRGGAASDAAVQALTSQMNEMKLNVEGLEKERDFYFNKVRIALALLLRVDQRAHARAA